MLAVFSDLAMMNSPNATSAAPVPKPPPLSQTPVCSASNGSETVVFMTLPTDITCAKENDADDSELKDIRML
jgi:hypothetical protein